MQMWVDSAQRVRTLPSSSDENVRTAGLHCRNTFKG